MEKNILENLLTPDQLRISNEYANLIFFENKKFNLTGLKNIEDIKNTLINESIISLFYANVKLNNAIKVIDIGTGAGIPGIPFKIINNNLDMTLVDSNLKKCNFLKKVSEELDLDIKIVCARTEDLAHDEKHRETYDNCISRAVSNISTLNEYSFPFLKISGKSIYIKGRNISQEIIDSEYSAKILGGNFINYSTPTNMSSIVIYEKVKKTPSHYPRKPGIPKKSPLGII